MWGRPWHGLSPLAAEPEPRSAPRLDLDLSRYPLAHAHPRRMNSEKGRERERERRGKPPDAALQRAQLASLTVFGDVVAAKLILPPARFASDFAVAKRATLPSS